MSADPNFVLDDGCLPAVVEVCRRLDGIPLAIELAAARVAAMSPAEIAGHLDERFRLLTGGRRGRVDRHQTLLAAVEWSYTLLNDTEREVFDRLGVFPAGFDEKAAVAVCGGEGVERWDVIDVLTSLVTKSMIGVERSKDTTRYQLLETLRQFARDRAGADLDGLRRRHAAHYAAFAERAGAALASPDELAWRPRLAAELDNLRAATNWAFDSANLDDVALGVSILDGLMLEPMARPSWGIQAWAADALPRVDQLTPAHRVVVFGEAAFDAFCLGQLDRAKMLGRRAIAESEAFTPALVVALWSVGFSVAAGGDPVGAMAVLTDGRRRIHTSEPPDWLVCILQMFIGWLAYTMGDQDTARSEARQALALARQVGAPTTLANVLSVYAGAVSDLDPAAALSAAEESLAIIAAGAGDSGYSGASQTVAMLRAANGDTAGAAAAIHAAIEHEAWVGNQAWVAADIRGAIFVLAAHPDRCQEAATLAGAVNGPVLGPLPRVGPRLASRPV